MPTQGRRRAPRGSLRAVSAPRPLGSCQAGWRRATLLRQGAARPAQPPKGRDETPPGCGPQGAAGTARRCPVGRRRCGQCSPVRPRLLTQTNETEMIQVPGQPGGEAPPVRTSLLPPGGGRAWAAGGAPRGASPETGAQTTEGHGTQHDQGEAWRHGDPTGQSCGHWAPRGVGARQLAQVRWDGPTSTRRRKSGMDQSAAGRGRAGGSSGLPALRGCRHRRKEAEAVQDRRGTTDTLGSQIWRFRRPGHVPDNGGMRAARVNRNRRAP